MLREIFTRLTKRCDKFEHYFPLYEKHFSKYIGKSPRILEIGVRGGGSLQMWQKYFGEGTYVHGIDIDAKCKAHEDIDNNIHVTIGDATDPVFVEREMSALLFSYSHSIIEFCSIEQLARCLGLYQVHID